MIRHAVTFHNTHYTRGTYVADHLVEAKARFLFCFYEMRLLMLKFKRLVIRFIGTGWCVYCPKSDWRGTNVSESLLELSPTLQEVMSYQEVGAMCEDTVPIASQII